MQAVKSTSKKSPVASGHKQATCCTDTHQQHKGGSTGKSIAQRVMEMATSNGNGESQAAVTGNNPTSSNNSVENDREVEIITNRLSHMPTTTTNHNNNNISPSNSQASTANDRQQQKLQHNNQQQHHQHNQAQGHAIRASSSSSLPQQHQPSSNGRISLETRVPHPQKSATFVGVGSHQEEVSYYNDTSLFGSQHQNQNQYQQDIMQQQQQAAAAACHHHLLEPKQVGGSLDNNTKPRMQLLAASVRDQKLGSSACHMSATSCQQLRQLPMVPQQQQQQQHLLGQHHHYDDMYDTVSYHNVPNLMLNRPSQAQLEDEAAAAAAATATQLHQRDLSATAGSSTRYQEIPDLLYDNDFDQQQQQQQQAAANNSTEEHQDDSTTCHHASAVSIVAGPGSCADSASSPKAKSAPATPCNVTPIAFHQTTGGARHGPKAGGCQLPNPAHTMPPDMRKNLATGCRMLPSGAHSSQHHLNQQQLLERAEAALRDKDYQRAVKLFGQCISLLAAAASSGGGDQSPVQLDKSHQLKRSFKIYAQRAEAHFQLGQYTEAIEDSMAARQLNPKWTQAYYLQGRSQFMVGRYADALAVFAFGLTQEPTSELLFRALVEAALTSKAPTGLSREFESKFAKLKALALETRPNLVVALLGQELLAHGHSEHAAITLESALKLWPSGSSSSSGTSSGSGSSSGGGGVNSNDSNSNNNNNTYSQQRRFKSSVLASIGAAFCALRDYDKALAYMHKELELERELEQPEGQCRVLSNLGHTYYKVRKFDDSLRAHREQLELALKHTLPAHACQAFSAAGHVHAIKGDLLNAVQSQECCLNLTSHHEAPFARFCELLAVGHLHAQSNNLKGAEDRFSRADELLKAAHAAGQLVSAEQLAHGTIMVNFNLAHLELRRAPQTRDSLQKAKFHYTAVAELARSLMSGGECGGGGGGSNKYSPLAKRALYEMRAYHGLGQTCRLLKELDEARGWFEKQLQLARALKNLVGQSQALCNLGLISAHCAHNTEQQQQQASTSWRYFEENLKLVGGNKLLRAYAHSYMGLAYSQRGRPKEARDHYETSLGLFKELGYSSAEQRTIEENIVAIQRGAAQAPADVMGLMSAGSNLPPGGTASKKAMLVA